jgi:hypothetical protein
MEPLVAEFVDRYIKHHPAVLSGPFITDSEVDVSFPGFSAMVEMVVGIHCAGC